MGAPAHAPTEPRLAEKRRSGEVSNAQIVQSISGNEQRESHPRHRL